MAGIQTGPGGGNKKSVNHEIPLIPFIDLLLCCVMFLLVTAVWTELSQISIEDEPCGCEAIEAPEPVRLILRVSNHGYTLADTLGVSTPIPLTAGDYDRDALQIQLAARKLTEPGRDDILVAIDDGVRYEEVIHAMDTAVGAGFPRLSVRAEAGGIHPHL